MRQLKYILECTGYGVLVAIVVHGMILLAARLTTGVWLNEGGKYWYAFVASVAMFGSLYALFDTMNKKVSNQKWHQYKYARYLLFSLFVMFPAIIWGSYRLNYSGPLRLTVIAERQIYTCLKVTALFKINMCLNLSMKPTKTCIYLLVLQVI